MKTIKIGYLIFINKSDVQQFANNLLKVLLKFKHKQIFCHINKNHQKDCLNYLKANLTCEEMQQIVFVKSHKIQWGGGELHYC